MLSVGCQIQVLFTMLLALLLHMLHLSCLSISAPAGGPCCLTTPRLHSCPRVYVCRDCPGAGTFDRVVSCEMIEAVGHEHLISYFQCIGRQLKQGGVAVIQVT